MQVNSIIAETLAITMPGRSGQSGHHHFGVRSTLGGGGD